MAAKSGDGCDCCRDGRYYTQRSMRSGDTQVRYLRCDRCGHTAKQVLPAECVQHGGNRRSGR